MGWLDVNKRINEVGIEAGDICLLRACESCDV